MTGPKVVDFAYHPEGPELGVGSVAGCERAHSPLGFGGW
jgi:hypothetical protein